MRGSVVAVGLLAGCRFGFAEQPAKDAPDELAYISLAPGWRAEVFYDYSSQHP